MILASQHVKIYVIAVQIVPVVPDHARDVHAVRIIVSMIVLEDVKVHVKMDAIQHAQMVAEVVKVNVTVAQHNVKEHVVLIVMTAAAGVRDLVVLIAKIIAEDAVALVKIIVMDHADKHVALDA